MISIFLNLLRLALCPIMWSIFEKVPWTLEKNVYFASLGWKALYISVKSISSRVLLSDTISLLIFCLGDLSIFDSGVLKSPTIIVLLSISFLKSSKIFLMYLGAPMLGAYIFTMFMSFGGFFLWVLWSDLLGPSLWPFFGSLFYLIWILLPLLFFPVRLLGKFVSSPSLSVCVSLLSWDGSLVGSICVGHAFLSIQLFYVFDWSI